MNIFGFYIHTKSLRTKKTLRDRLIEFVENYDEIVEMNNVDSFYKEKEMANILIEMIQDVLE